MVTLKTNQEIRIDLELKRRTECLSFVSDIPELTQVWIAKIALDGIQPI